LAQVKKTCDTLRKPPCEDEQLFDVVTEAVDESTGEGKTTLVGAQNLSPLAAKLAQRDFEGMLYPDGRIPAAVGKWEVCAVTGRRGERLPEPEEGLERARAAREAFVEANAVKFLETHEGCAEKERRESAAARNAAKPKAAPRKKGKKT